MTQQHKLDATVFVYRHKRTGQIQAHYIDLAKLLEDDNEWEHIASLEPRMWIECNYSNADRLEQAEKLVDALESALSITSAHVFASHAATDGCYPRDVRVVQEALESAKAFKGEV